MTLQVQGVTEAPANNTEFWQIVFLVLSLMEKQLLVYPHDRKQKSNMNWYQEDGHTL